MVPYPHINPEIIHISGRWSIRWYGMMYLLGFVSSYLLVNHQIKRKKLPLSRDFLDSLYTYIVLGLLIGARLGYVVFYNPVYYAQHPWEIIDVLAGGMSFHGGLIGSVLAGVLCCRKYKADPWQIADLVTATAPIGLGLGRLGNFINGELYGRITTVPWAMIFPGGGNEGRHPSQLYEFFLEGVVLFTIVWIVKDRVERPGVLTSIFIMLYGAFRFFVEFFREPDPQLGFILGPFSMGQVLSALMVFAGLAIFLFRRRKEQG